MIWADGITTWPGGSLEVQCTPSPTRHRRRMREVLDLADERTWMEALDRRPVDRQALGVDSELSQ